MIIVFLVTALVGIAGFLFQWVLGLPSWVTYAGAVMFPLGVVGMMITALVQKKQKSE